MADEVRLGAPTGTRDTLLFSRDHPEWDAAERGRTGEVAVKLGTAHTP
jgi:hypothetical protein